MSIPRASAGGVIGGVIGGAGTAAPPPPPKAAVIGVGGAVQAAKLVNRVQPIYPPLARQTRISGTVKLHALIDMDGNVLELEVVSGHPLLIQSAMDAVKQWKYQPTLVNGQPARVDTEIDVIFALAQ
jgi:protein TonB